MKHFLTLFWAFIGFLICFTTPTKADAPLDKVPETFHAVLKNAERGATKKLEFPWGEARLLSCQTGFKGQSLVLAGLRLAFDPDVVLHEYQLEVHTPKTVKSFNPPPLKPDWSGNNPWTQDYRDSVIFPIVLSIADQTEDFSLMVSALLTICPQNEACYQQPLAFTLPLSAAESYTTGWCGSLRRSLQSVAAPPHHLTVESNLISPTDLQARITFPDTLSRALVQSRPFQAVHIVNQTMSGKNLDITLRPTNGDTFQVGTVVPILVKTNRGGFAVDVPVTEGTPLSRKTIPVPWRTVLLFGFILFFFSPFWAYWLSPSATKVALFREQLADYIKAAAGAMFLWSVCWWWDAFPPALIRSYWGIAVSVFALLYLLINPVQSPLKSLIFFILLPRPFGDALMDASYTVRLIAPWYWGICIVLPFWWWLSHAGKVQKIFRHLKKTDDAYPIFVRLPYLMLLIWISVGLLGQPRSDDVDTDKLSPVLIQVSEPVCLSCLIDNQITLRDAVVKKAVYNHGLHIVHWRHTEPRAQQLMKRVNATHLPLYVLRLPDGREITVLSPLTPLHLGNAFSQLESRP